MVRNILILCGDDGAAEYAAKLAAEAGDDRGLVNTAVDPGAMQSGSRVEDDRSYGGVTVSAFDEPLEVGSAVAQLAGTCDVVVIDRLDDWAQRLVQHLGGDEARVASEVTSVESVMAGQLADMTILLSRPKGAAAGAAAAVHESMLSTFEPCCDTIIDLTTGQPQAVKGDLPG
jgi:adenosyl cobinamide kinase/adenosyl cobinamide phosphate guanylyltransferase